MKMMELNITERKIEEGDRRWRITTRNYVGREKLNIEQMQSKPQEMVEKQAKRTRNQHGVTLPGDRSNPAQCGP